MGAGSGGDGGARLDGIVLPKVESADALLAVDSVLATVEAEQGLQSGSLDLPIIETARCGGCGGHCDRGLQNSPLCLWRW